MTRSTHHALIAVVLLALQATALPSVAAGRSPKQRAKVHFKKAQKHYDLGRFEKALGHFSQAYEVLPLPAFLYNIGQCHRQLKNHDKAIFFFQGYLRETLEPDDADAVNALIATEEAARDREKSKNAESDKLRERLAVAEAERARAEEQRKAEAGRANSQSDGAKPGDTTVGDISAATQAGAPQPFYQEHWPWLAAGGAAAVLGTLLAVIALSGEEVVTVPPSGSLGTFDRR